MQRNRKDSEDFETEQGPPSDLNSSFVSSGPELEASQKKMLYVFMLMQLVQTFISVSLGPLYASLVVAYNISVNTSHSLYLISLLAQIIAFLPTNLIIGKYGIKKGLSMCLGGAVIGSLLCLFINKSFLVFMIGYFFCQFWMSSVHTGKGNFVNLYYVEKQVSLSVLFLFLETNLLQIIFEFNRFREELPIF